MNISFEAFYDGRALRPMPYTELPTDKVLKVTVEITDKPVPRHADLLALAGMIKDPDLPSDLSEQHDHYLYGTPKRRMD